MARYNIAYRTVDGTAAQPNTEIRATSSDRPLLMELHMMCVAATAGSVGIGVPALIGVTPTTSYRVIAEDPAVPLGATIVATAWTTAPTVPAFFYRRLYLKAAIGQPLIVGFPRGLTIPQSGSLVLWNIATNPLFDVSMTVDE
jgi:uncharacterized membrane protein